MELAEAVRGRRMTRNFLDVLPDRSLVTSLFVDALRAPSAGFVQAAEFLILTEPDRRERFWSIVSDESWREQSSVAGGLLRAPVIALCLVDAAAYRERYAAADKRGSALAGGDGETWNVAYPTVDAAFATMIVLLGAEAAGLGALFFHLQGRDRAVLDGLGIPSRFAAIGAVALGHRARALRSRSPEQVERRADSARVHFESYAEA